MHGFELLREEKIAELNTRALLYRHQRTGAELLSLCNDDENKVFGITFRTPPPDSTGVAHILEHSVLCGSRKYPVKEPFVELLKGSLNTFLNAFTYPDKTCYPVASQNLQDFYNLIDVYLDAVFYPRLTPFVLQQEGWHFELEDPAQPLTYKGVVFNEMKGAYSSPESLLSEYSLQSIFPDTPYGFDSGGDPEHIPDLTFKQFKSFHDTYYHPSNARLYFYGDDDPDHRLWLANQYVEKFDRLEIDSRIPLQPTLQKPRRIVRPYMVGQSETAEPKGMITLNWLLNETMDVQTNFALRMLEYILLGMPASPLRKALIDSGLGEDLAGDGLGTELRQIYFSTGLKGIDMKAARQVEGLIIETLENLAREGIDPLTTHAAINTIEFRMRENNTGRFPRGLLLMLRALTTWLYDGDPLALLAFDAPLKAVKSQARSQNHFFEALIHGCFLKNPHRATLILEPDPDLHQQVNDKERDRLETARNQMGPDGLERVVSDSLELKRRQQQPDPPDALATIPTLKLTDLDPENKAIPIETTRHQEATLLFHDLFTNGIAYVDLGFDLHTLDAKYLPYVPLFGRALLEMGTESEDFVALSQRISRHTGGIRPESLTASVRESTRSAAWLFLRCKAMAAQTDELISILQDILLTVRLDNRDRFRQMVLEAKARAEQGLIPSGHQVVNLRLRAHFDEAHWAAEQMGGIHQLLFLRDLVGALETDWAGVHATLEDIRAHLVNRKSMVVNVTLDSDNWRRFQPDVHRLMESLPLNPAGESAWSMTQPPLFEGLTMPSQVNYVGKGANLYELGYRFHGSAAVITRFIRTAWLWDQVRVQGGAYGAFCLFDRLSGTLTFVSYRDPNLERTLGAFDETSRFLKKTDLGESELTKAIIGAIGDLDTHMLPDAKGYASMGRYLSEDTESTRQQMRSEILCTEPSHFRAFAEVLDQVSAQGIVKVLGSADAIGAGPAGTMKPLQILKVR